MAMTVTENRIGPFFSEDRLSMQSTTPEVHNEGDHHHRYNP
jgi:hypothetical protein